MEIIALILIIVLVSLSGKGKKKQQGDAAQPGANARRQAAQVPQRASRQRAATTPVSKMSLHEREARMAELRGKREAREAARAVAQPTVKAPEQRAAEEFDASLTELRELLNVANAAPAEGEGDFRDAEGCVGGSLEHTHEEGESREEHARHIAAMEARDAEEAAAFAVKRGVSAADMRRAVVMSEVLGRPKALAGRR